MKKKQFLVLVATLVSIFGIYWINAGMTSLKRTSDVAGREEVINYTLPPGFIFSIWGFIYIGFIIYAFYGLKASAQQNAAMQRTAYPVAISIVLNLVWTVVVGLGEWKAAYPLQWGMLVLAIYLLRQWRLEENKISALQKWMSIPFALYAGWLTVAMIPFTSDLLNDAGWSGGPFSREVWAVIMYTVATALVVWAYTALRQPFYLFPLAWALFGFALRFNGLPQLAAAVLCGLLLLYFLTQVYSFYNPGSKLRLSTGNAA